MAFTYPVLKQDSQLNDPAAVKKLVKLLLEYDSSFDIEGLSKFDYQVAYAVDEYQRANGLVRDTVVGKCTWKALMKEDMDINHYGLQPQAVAQPNESICWMAATATLLQCSLNQISSGSAQYTNGGLNNDDNNLKLYAKEHFMRWERVSFNPGSLGSLLIQKRMIMMNVDDDYAGYQPGANFHWLVLFRMRTDGSSTGTTLTFWDPMPANKGSRLSMSLNKFKGFYKSHMAKI